LHTHTAFCDGSGTPGQAYTRAREKGLDFFALTPTTMGKRSQVLASVATVY